MATNSLINSFGVCIYLFINTCVIVYFVFCYVGIANGHRQPPPPYLSDVNTSHKGEIDTDNETASICTGMSNQSNNQFLNQTCVIFYCH